MRHNTAGGRVTIWTSASPEQAGIAIGNTGPQVSGHDLERLFQPFHQAGGQRIRHDGHGLGLAIALAIAEAHGAEISPRPRPEGGLDIDVTFRTRGFPPVS